MFEWDENKNQLNIEKHGISLEIAKRVFNDPNRLTLLDGDHSEDENRYFCIGKTDEGIATVRFVVRDDKIRIIGAGYWRKGKKRYENRD